MLPHRRFRYNAPCDCAQSSMTLQPVSPCDLHQRIEIDALAVEMYRNDRTGARRDSRFDLADVHQKIVIPDVDKDRTSAENLDRGYRRHRGVRHRDHLVAGTHASRRKRDVDGIRSAVDPDAASYADIGRHVAFERDPFRPENELPGLEYPVDGAEDLLAQFVIFASIIPERRQHL